jgi:hypothetical protein
MPSSLLGKIKKSLVRIETAAHNFTFKESESSNSIDFPSNFSAKPQEFPLDNPTILRKSPQIPTTRKGSKSIWRGIPVNYRDFGIEVCS